MKKISSLSGAERDSYLQQFREAPSHLKKKSSLKDLKERVEKARAEKLKKAS